MIWHGLDIRVTASGAHIRSVVDTREFADWLRDEGRTRSEILAAVQGHVWPATKAWIEVRHDEEICNTKS